MSRAPDAGPFWNGRRVLVTGSRGFIGRALCARLAKLGAEVRGVTRTARAASAAEVPHAAADLTRVEECRALIGDFRPDRIIHLAGHPFGARDLERVLPTFRDNLVTTVHVLTSAAELGTGRVVLAGSLEEPDPASDPEPSSPYAASKWAASVYARLFHRLYALPVTVARIFMVYGPGQAEPTKLIPSVCRALLSGQAPRVGAGDRRVDWVYVDDVARGLALLAEHPGVEGRTVDLGTGVLTSVRQVVEQLAALVPGAPAPQFGAVPSRPFEQVRAADPEATRRALGWAPETTLAEGLPATLDWFRAQGESPE